MMRCRVNDVPIQHTHFYCLTGFTSEYFIAKDGTVLPYPLKFLGTEDG